MVRALRAIDSHTLFFAGGGFVVGLLASVGWFIGGGLIATMVVAVVAAWNRWSPKCTTALGLGVIGSSMLPMVLTHNWLKALGAEGILIALALLISCFLVPWSIVRSVKKS